MLVSIALLQKHIREKLPPAKEIADKLTRHAFEVEEVRSAGGDTVLDIDILPNRAHDCLSHEGVAREICALFGFTYTPPHEILAPECRARGVDVVVENDRLCPRYIARVVEGVKNGRSPAWLREALETLGQRSINTIVDITNYVMLMTGQPMHAFDKNKVTGKIFVRHAKEGERMTTLDGKELALNETMLVVADEAGPLALAGVKGGRRAEVGDETTDVILESANFSSVQVRKTAHATGIHTDSVKRFENRIAPEMAPRAMELAISLILGEYDDAAVSPPADAYPRKRGVYMTGVSVAEINDVLGTALSERDVSEVFDALGWTYEAVDPSERVLSAAKELEGVPYAYGASISYDAPRAFDCSSFVSYVFSRAGITVPRMTVDQFVFGEPVARDELRPGDIIFSYNGSGDEMSFVNQTSGETVSQKTKQTHSREFLPGTPVPEGVDHNGLYLGDGIVMHAAGKWYKGRVVVEKLEDTPAFRNIRGYRRIPAIRGRRFAIKVPVNRLDIRIKEDVIEEVARIVGYANIESASNMRKKNKKTAAVNKKFFYEQRLRDMLVSRGFSEVYSSSFADKGKVAVANPIASNRGFLRENLSERMGEMLKANKNHMDLLGASDLKMFEFGNVFGAEKEVLSLCLGFAYGKKRKGDPSEREVLESVLAEIGRELGAGGACLKSVRFRDGVAEIDFDDVVAHLPDVSDYGDVLNTNRKRVAYKKISPFPSVARDIAVLAPADVREGEVRDVLRENAGSLLAREPRLFDVFRKTGDDGAEKVSYAFRLVFQSHERTLTDAEVNQIMDGVTKAVTSLGWVVR